MSSHSLSLPVLALVDLLCPLILAYVEAQGTGAEAKSKPVKDFSSFLRGFVTMSPEQGIYDGTQQQ